MPSNRGELQHDVLLLESLVAVSQVLDVVDGLAQHARLVQLTHTDRQTYRQTHRHTDIQTESIKSTATLSHLLIHSKPEFLSKRNIKSVCFNLLRTNNSNITDLIHLCSDDYTFYQHFYLLTFYASPMHVAEYNTVINRHRNNITRSNVCGLFTSSVSTNDSSLFCSVK